MSQDSAENQADRTAVGDVERVLGREQIAERPRGDRRPLLTVTALKPRCPLCRSDKLRRYRSIADQGDGTSLSWMLCLNQTCGKRFKLLLK